MDDTLGGFRVETLIDGCIADLRLYGEVDASTAPALREAIALADLAEPDELVLHCGGLEFIDSSGLGVLVAAHKRAHDRGGVLVVAEAPPAVRRLFAISALDQLLIIRE